MARTKFIFLNDYDACLGLEQPNMLDLYSSVVTETIVCS